MKQNILKNIFYPAVLIVIIFIIIGIVGLLFEDATYVDTRQQACVSGVSVGEHFFEAEFATTFALRQQGLSDRIELPTDEGMLFIFPTASTYGFWMRNMNFPLDILWIVDDEVVDISRDLPPEGEQPENVYRPRVPVTHVFEINAGLSDELGITEGDVVQLRYCDEIADGNRP